MRQLRSQGADPERQYWFPVVGFNYRMTNLAAALGLAQLETAPTRVTRYREVASWYLEELAAVDGLSFQVEQPGAKSAWWMVTVLVDDKTGVGRDGAAEALSRHGVETRPVFYPMHVLPPYRDQAAGSAFPVSDRVASHGLSLPTWAGLTRDDVSYVCDVLKAAVSS